MVLPALQWSGGPARADGTNSYWNPAPLAEAGVNLVSVIYRPLDAQGKPLAGWYLPSAEQYGGAMEHAAADLALSRELGIRVMGYTDTVQFNQELMQTTYGYKLEDLAVQRPDGSYVFTTQWDPNGCYVACINSPAWKNLLADIQLLTAKAGFASLMYDYYPYAAGGYFCHCPVCREKWAAYSKEALGESKPMLTDFAFPEAESLAYYTFRMECYADFMKETSAKAKAYNPDYEVLQNHNMNSYDLPVQMLLGGIDAPTSEYWGVENGTDSTLYMMQLAEALGADRLYSYYNEAAQWTPAWKYKVNLAESYAVCGGQMLQQEDTNTAAGFFDFVRQRPHVYAGSRSIARTGILYSWKSSLLNDLGVNMEKGYFSYSTNLTRQAATAVLKAGVPSDFVAMEREGAAGRMLNYDVLVVPEYDYFDETVWREPLRAFVKRGGGLIVLGESAHERIGKMLEGLEGRVWYVEDFTLTASDEDMTLPDAFRQAVEDSGAATQLRLNDASLSATVRQNGPDIYLHIIRRGDPALHKNDGVSFTFMPPDGFQAAKITAACPYAAQTEIPVAITTEKDGRVRVQAETFDTYLLVTLTP